MNSNEILVGIAILPVIALLFYVYKKDPNKETFGSLFKIFVFGVISTIPAAILEIIVDKIIPTNHLNLFTLFIYVFIGVALIEEFVKWFIVKTFIYKTDKFDEYYDAVVYCTYVSLGFACLENIGYVLQSGISVGIMRALTSVPGHTCFGIIMGYYLCYTKFNELRSNKEASKYNILSLLYPVIAHTLYDYLLMVAVSSSRTNYYTVLIIWLIFYIILLVYCIKLINKVSKQNQQFYSVNPVQNYQQPSQINNTENKTCPSCGNPNAYGNFCSKCGYRFEK